LRNNFRCISFDHRGHGESEITSDGYGLDNLVTDAICLIEKLEIGSVHFIGMSTGGFVGMRLALRKPELLKSLILMNTSAEEEGEKELKEKNLLLWVVKNIGWFPVIGELMSVLFHKSFLKDKSRRSEVKEWRKIIMNQNKKGIIPFGKGIFAREKVLEELSNLNIPTAVIVGGGDIATPPEFNKRIADVIPNAEYYIIPDAGHSAAVERPTEVVSAMRKFYSEIGLL
jgi:pimeloyl-ACP methyl ester carboxylesterase